VGKYTSVRVDLYGSSPFAAGMPVAPAHPALADGVASVPGEFGTIAEAIAAAPANGTTTVSLASGVYGEAIDLAGKSIVLRGAGADATILDGAGLATAVVTLDGAPATAVVSDLAIRGGRFGGVSAIASEASIERVRFESNSAANGGAVFYRDAVVRIAQCEFVGNTASLDGGAVYAEGSDGVIESSVFEANLCGLDGEGSGSAILISGSRSEGGAVAIVGCEATGNIGPSGSAAIEVRGAACVLDGTAACGNEPANLALPCVAEPGTGCEGEANRLDLTGDGVVDAADLTALLASWESGDLAADLDGDGAVGAADLALILQGFAG
jgi:predicted outer membrane repeat protein